MKNEKPAILVTGTGGAASQGIVKCLNMTGNYRVVTTDIDPLLPGVYRGCPGYLVSRDWQEYIKELLGICKKEKIAVLIPGSDFELEAISKNKDLLENEGGAKVIISTPEAIAIANDKWKTYKFLIENDFRSPNSCLPNEIKDGHIPLKFPVVVKPRFGWASMHVYLALNYAEVKSYMTHIESAGLEPIIQEFIPEENQEYTSGVLISKDKEIIGAITLWRMLKSGLSHKVIVDDYPEIKGKMIEIASKLNTVGSVNIQCRLWNNEPYVFEINSRFSGTTIVQAMAGINGPDALVRNYLYNEKIHIDSHKNLVAMMYTDYLYVKTDEYKKLLEERHINKTGTIGKWF